MEYQTLAKNILVALGGESNIISVSHCITRLRVTLNDFAKVDKVTLEVMEGVQGIIDNDYEIQVIIGTDVMNVYSCFNKLVEKKGEVKNPSSVQKKKLNILDIILKYLSGSIIPILPILCCAAVIATVCTILTTFFGMSPKSGAYIIFNTFYSAFYDYLPVFIGFGAAKVLGINNFYGAFLGAIMVHGNISGAEGLDFFGIGVPTMSYGSTIVPILLGVAFMSVVDNYIGSKIPKVISFIFRPFVVLAITVPVTLIILGPLGSYIGTYVAIGITWIHETFGFFAIGILGFIFPLLIASGMGNAILPIFLQLFLTNGYESFLIPASLCANIAIGASVLAVAMKSKVVARKQIALASGFTAVCGITEPAIYGVALPLKKPLLAGMFGGAIGGLFAGFMGVKMYAFNAAGLVTLPLFIAPDGSMNNFYLAIIAALIAATIGFVVSYMLGFKETEITEVKE